MEIIIETKKDPYAILWPDGTKWETERTVTTISEVRDTPWGKMMFGYVIMGPPKRVR